GPTYRLPLANTGPVLIGYGAGDGNFEGILDDVMIFDEALAPNQVASLAGGGTGTNLPPAAFPAPQLFTAPHGVDGRWNLYEVRGNGVGSVRPWWEAHVAATNTLDPTGCTLKRGNLVSVLSGEENVDLANMAGGGDIWIGLTDDDLVFGGTEAGTSRTMGWVWTSGEPFSFEAFGGGEPNDVGGEDVVHIRPDTLWNDHRSNIPGSGQNSGVIQAKYVIEWNLNAPVPIPGATVIEARPSVALTPVGGMNALDITVHAQGNAGGFPIDAMDTETVTISGMQNMDLQVSFDPTNHTATAGGIEFTDGTLIVNEDPVFNLNLGLFVGSVAITGSNLRAVMDTPTPPAPLVGNQTVLNDHELILNQGRLAGRASGLAATLLDPFDIDLSVNPIQGQLGAGLGTVTVGPPMILGTMATYDIQVDLPIDFSDIFLNDPVDVTVSMNRTVRLSGQLTRQLPDWDNDGLLDLEDPDDDNDMLDDAWEKEYQLDPLTADDLTVDEDQDGHNLGEEYVTDTNPFDPTSFQWLSIMNTGVEEEQILIFPTSARREYSVQGASNLMNGFWFDTPHSNFIGSGSIMNQAET
ncbi:MAG: C-type lectin domain-containing protein, partial [Verrucomicrobiota bacterium]